MTRLATGPEIPSTHGRNRRDSTEAFRLGVSPAGLALVRLLNASARVRCTSRNATKRLYLRLGLGTRDRSRPPDLNRHLYCCVAIPAAGCNLDLRSRDVVVVFLKSSD